MGLQKQAKTLNRRQIEMVFTYLGSRRNRIRNQVIFLLSIRAGLRAKEIASITWSTIVDADGKITDYINLTNIASKGNSGRVIPINRQLKLNLIELHTLEKQGGQYGVSSWVIRTERKSATSPQVIVNMFQGWYTDLGLIGCSSHHLRVNADAEGKVLD